jgi:hypothetical protein
MQVAKRILEFLMYEDQQPYRFPLVLRGFDLETQSKIQRAMQELSRETTSRIAEASPLEGEA